MGEKLTFTNTLDLIADLWEDCSYSQDVSPQIRKEQSLAYKLQKWDKQSVKKSMKCIVRTPSSIVSN